MLFFLKSILIEVWIYGYNGWISDVSRNGVVMPERSGQFDDYRNFFKTWGYGIAFSEVQQKTLSHVYFTAKSDPAKSDSEQIVQISNAVRDIITQKNVRETVTDMTVFLRSIEDKELLRLELKNLFGGHLPAITYVSHPSCHSGIVSLEFHAIQGTPGHFSIERPNESTVRLRYDDISILYCADILPERKSLGAYKRSLSAFSNMKSFLIREGCEFSQIYRTWIYQGHIVAPEGETQRYKELNRARTDFFFDTKFLTPFLTQEYQGVAYPASTGIGANDYDVVMSCQAMVTDRRDVIMTPIENPEQTSAFDYGEVYSPKSPKFARAMAFVVGTDATVYVSGTASITDSESRHPDDPVKQTEQTLDNIEALISGKNLAAHGIHGLEAGLHEFATARIYIKNQEDYEVVRRYCQQRLGATPTIYTTADICRPELLVEIEGIVIPRRVESTSCNP